MIKMKTALLCALLAGVSTGSPLADSAATESSHPAQVSTVYQFPKDTWLENINQRPSGQVLTTELYTPRVWQVDPRKPATQKPILVADITEKTGLLGITEISRDVFAVVAGRFTANASETVPGSFSVFSIDLNKTPAKVSKIADLPDAGLLNGLIYLSGSVQKAYPKGLILGTDSHVGAIWAVDPATSKVTKWAQDSLMRACQPVGIGINGLKYNAVNNRVYFTNSGCEGGYLASLPLNKNTAKPAGPSSIVGGKAQGLFLDDFDLEPKANKAYSVVATTNQVAAIDLTSGKLTPIAGSNGTATVARGTAVYVGRTKEDIKQGVLYVSTAGLVGEQDVGGQVLAIKK